MVLLPSVGLALPPRTYVGPFLPGVWPILRPVNMAQNRPLTHCVRPIHRPCYGEHSLTILDGGQSNFCSTPVPRPTVVLPSSRLKELAQTTTKKKTLSQKRGSPIFLGASGHVTNHRSWYPFIRRRNGSTFRVSRTSKLLALSSRSAMS